MRSAYPLFAIAALACTPTPVIVQPAAPPRVVRVEVPTPCPSARAPELALAPEPASEPASELASEIHLEPAPPLPPAPVPAPRADRGERVVAFRVFPNHVTVRVGGHVVRNNDQITLSVGQHTLVAKDRCCEATTRALTVVAPPVDQPQRTQVASVALELKPAVVSLAGAPAGGQLSCPRVGVVVPHASSAKVAMAAMSQVASCRFMPIGKRASVHLQAGAHVTVMWPSP